MSWDKDLLSQVKDVRLTGVFYFNGEYMQKLHKHHHELEILYIYSGEGYYHVGQREYTVQEGDILICNADTLHGETLPLNNKIEIYSFVLSGLKIKNIPPDCLISQKDSPIMALKRFKDIIHSIMPHIYDCIMLEEMEYELARQMILCVLCMIWKELQMRGKAVYSPMQDQTNVVVQEITNYIDQHFTEDIRIKDISQILHISVSRLSHLFKEETGLSPKQYIILRRIGEAQSLLETTTIPIGCIEEHLGFGNSCHLTKMFKKYVGITPREYRKTRRQKNLIE